MTLISVVSAASAAARALRGRRQVSSHDSTAGTRARHGGQVDARLARTPSIGRRGHHAAQAYGRDRRGSGFGGGRGRRRCSGLGCGAVRLGRRRAGLRGCSRFGRLRTLAQLEHDQRRADGHFVAGRAGDGDDTAAHRRRYFHGCLVGHHFNDELIFAHRIAGLGVPGDNLGIDRALAQVRHLECELTHAGSMTVLSAALNRA